MLPSYGYCLVSQYTDNFNTLSWTETLCGLCVPTGILCKRCYLLMVIPWLPVIPLAVTALVRLLCLWLSRHLSGSHIRSPGTVYAWQFTVAGIHTARTPASASLLPFRRNVCTHWPGLSLLSSEWAGRTTIPIGRTKLLKGSINPAHRPSHYYTRPE